MQWILDYYHQSTASINKKNKWFFNLLEFFVDELSSKCTCIDCSNSIFGLENKQRLCNNTFYKLLNMNRSVWRTIFYYFVPQTQLYERPHLMDQSKWIKQQQAVYEQQKQYMKLICTTFNIPSVLQTHYLLAML